MRTRNPTMSKSSSWPKAKTVVKKWLNLQNSEFHSDCCTHESFGAQSRRKSCSDRDGSLLTRTGLSGPPGGWLVQSSDSGSLRLPPPRYGSPVPTSSWRPPKELRMFVGTWNVGGRGPHGGLDLSDWLRIDGPASSSPHIYVLGFQEIVPLNAGNVLGAEDKGPARKWLHLIRRALNPPPSAAAGAPALDSGSRSRSRSSPSGRSSFSDLLAAAEEDNTDDDDAAGEPSTSPSSSSGEEAGGSDSSSSSSSGRAAPRRGQHGYRLAASKQMVGVLLCVWVRDDVAPCVGGVAASCVGRGLMGYMGNKGAVSVSLALNGGAALCFVCTHLASGDRAADAARRNGDVAEILRRTRFSRSRGRGRRPLPETILEHDKVIWLGDLNYRLVAGGGGEAARELVEREEWAALLERDELRAEQRAGRVFAGWEEGRIRFPPTYKYVAESDAYAIHDDCSSAAAAAGPREKKRTPAWCDRILWRGSGVAQQWYARGESRFSDHRPVCALFSARLHRHQDGDATVVTAAAEAALLAARPRRRGCPPQHSSSRF